MFFILILLYPPYAILLLWFLFLLGRISGNFQPDPNCLVILFHGFLNDENYGMLHEMQFLLHAQRVLQIMLAILLLPPI